MPKLYYPTPDELQGATPLNELVWFEQYQHLLVKLANTDWGRDLLLIDKYPYPVVAIGKNFVRFDMGWQDGQHMFKSDVRIGAKWANIIRYRWLEVKKAIDRMILLSVLESWHPIYDRNGKLLLPVGGGTATTFYPDPDSEGSPTTVDGDIDNVVASTTWATVRNATNGTAVDYAGINLETMVGATLTDGEWEQIKRTAFLFDTNSIPGIDTIVSATLEFVCVYRADFFTSSVSIVTSDPASNTALVTEDFDQFGTDIQAPDRTFASLAIDNSTYNAATLNADGLASIEKAGITKFGLRVTADRTNTEPTWATSYANAHLVTHSADRTGSTDPKLVVNHSPPFTPRAMMF